jgi:phospholipid/cholesterol/gamma-HCH transport system substrate-binding protein
MLSKELKVGAFVLAGLTVVGALIFVIGDSRRMFERHAEYSIVFQQIQGLGRGSPVRMGGLDVGSVADVRYGENAKDDRIYVTVSIATSEAVRIRQDSVASIASKGLLGDKMVIITTGSPNAQALPPGSTIRSEEAQDLEEIIGNLKDIGSKASQVMDNLQKTTDTLANEQFREDVRAGMASLRKLLDSVANGKGYANKLLTDEAEAQRLSSTIANLEKTSASLDDFVAGLNTAVARVNHGPGLAHEVIYGGDDAVSSVSAAADETALLLKEIRAQGGGQKLGEALNNLSAASQDLKALAADLRAGKGTLGALLVDPSVYEDVKVLLGNVQRNEALRALVRYSIRSDERQPPRAVDRGAADPASDKALGGATIAVEGQK